MHFGIKSGDVTYRACWAARRDKRDTQQKRKCGAQSLAANNRANIQL